MRLNPDAVRAILLSIEINTVYTDNSKPFTRPYMRDIEIINGAQTLYEEIPRDDLKYAFELLLTTPYIELAAKPVYDSSHNLSFVKVKGLTYAGAEFLETIRPDTLWLATKKQVQKVGDGSIHAIGFVAKEIIHQIISNPDFLVKQ